MTQLFITLFRTKNKENNRKNYQEVSNKQIPQKQKNRKLEESFLPQEIKKNLNIDNHRDFEINHEKSKNLHSTI